MDMLFAAEKPWAWEAERNFAILKEQNPLMVGGERQGSVDLEKRRALAVHAEHTDMTLG